MKRIALLVVLLAALGLLGMRLHRTDLPVAPLVVIGNSIALHEPAPAVGWTNTNGMAASTPANDYAHLIGASRVFNLATLERGQPYTLPAIAPGDVLVLQLGDNVAATDIAGFAVRYSDLLRTLRPDRLVCISTWWEDPAKDAAIRKGCDGARGTFVFIGDIFTSQSNPDRTERKFADVGVNNHPHDWGMARIAERVQAALKTPVL